MTTKDYKEAARELREFDTYYRETLFRKICTGRWLLMWSMYAKYRARRPRLPAKFKSGGCGSSTDSKAFILPKGESIIQPKRDEWEYPDLPPFKVRHIS